MEDWHYEYELTLYVHPYALALLIFLLGAVVGAGAHWLFT